MGKLHDGAKPISTKFVFRKKLLSDGTVGRYKVRLVVKGFMQGEFDRTYSPVVDFTTIRTCISVAIRRGYSILQMDVRTAFLHGKSNEDVYVAPPEGSGVHFKDGEVLKLNKVLYRLRQAPRLWYEKWQVLPFFTRFQSGLNKGLRSKDKPLSPL